MKRQLQVHPQESVSRRLFPRSLLKGIFIFLSCAALFYGCKTSPVMVENPFDPSMTQIIAPAWQALWANDFEKSREIFTKALDTKALKGEAQRGLALIAYAEGNLDEFKKAALDSAYINSLDPNNNGLIYLYSDYIKDKPWLNQNPEYWDLLSAFQTNPSASWLTALGRSAALAASAYGSEPHALEINSGVISVQDWKFLGPFKTQDLEKSTLLKGDSENLRDTSLAESLSSSWTNSYNTNKSGDISPVSFLGGDNASYFANSQIFVKEAKDYWFVFDRSCGLELWLDGARVFSDPVYREGQEMHWLRFSLNKGRHDIILKLNSKNRTCRFTLNLYESKRSTNSDKAANLVLRSLPGLENTQDTDPLLARVAANTVISNLSERSFWLISLLLRKGYPESALALLDSEAAQVKDSLYFNYLRSKVYKSLGLSREADELMSKLCLQAPKFYPSAEYRTYSLLDEALYTAAEKQAAPFSPQNRSGNWLPELTNALVSINKNTASANTTIRNFITNNPKNMELHRYIIGFGNPMDIELSYIVNNLENAYYPLGNLSELSEFLYYQGLRDSAGTIAKILRTEREAEASTSYYWIRYRLAGGGSYDDVVNICKKFPTNFSILSSSVSYVSNAYNNSREGRALGKLGLSKERIPEAQFFRIKDNYKTILGLALKLRPDIYYYRRELNALEEKGDWDILVKQSNPLEIIQNYKESPVFSGRDSVILSEETDAVFFKDGGSRTYISIVLAIQSAKGLEEESTQLLSSYYTTDLLEAYSIRQDGSVAPAALSGRHVTFPGAQVGDFLVLRFAINSSTADVIPGEFWDYDYFQFNSPLVQKYFNVIYPDNKELLVSIHNDPSEQIKLSEGNYIDGFKYKKFTASNIDRVLPGATYDYDDTYPWVDVSTLKSWTPIIDWYYRLANERANPSYPVVRKAKELTQGAKSREEIIRKLYNFAANSIRYEDLSFQYSAYMPQSAESILYDNYGDCKDKAALFIALLRASGIDAYFALSEPNYWGENTFMPSQRFSHAIVNIPGGLSGTDSADFIMDPTTEFFTYPQVPSSMENTPYLPIRPELAKISDDSSAQFKNLLRIPQSTRKANTSIIELSVTTKASKISGVLVCEDIQGAIVRIINKGNDEAAKKRSFQTLLSQTYPGLILDSVEVLYADSLDSTPVLKFEGSYAPGYVSQSNENRYRLYLPWDINLGDGWQNFASLRKQETTSFALRNNNAIAPQSSSILLTLPDNLSLSQIPVSETFSFKDAKAVFTVKREGNTLSFSYDLSIPPLEIADNEKEAFANFIASIRAKQKEYLVLSPR